MVISDVAGELEVPGRQAALSARVPQAQDRFAVVDPLVECVAVFVGLFLIPSAD